MNLYMLNIKSFTILFAFQWGLLGTLLIKNKKIKNFWFLTFWVLRGYAVTRLRILYCIINCTHETIYSCQKCSNERKSKVNDLSTLKTSIGNIARKTLMLTNQNSLLTVKLCKKAVNRTKQSTFPSKFIMETE